jgi:hypothetical protein
MSEERTLLDAKFLVLLVEHHRADDIGGQQIGRELDAGKGRGDDLGEGPDGESLGEARHAFEQHMATGQQADEQAFDHELLADDASGHLLHGERNPAVGGCGRGCLLCGHAGLLLQWGLGGTAAEDQSPAGSR